MTDSQREFEISTDDHVEIDNDSHPGERAQRLQLMVVYLLEKNEQLRMQLIAMGADGQNQPSRAKDSMN